jgi:signal transduction histidine kinase
MDSGEKETVIAERPGIEELRSIPVFSDLAPADLEWLASQMTVVEVQPRGIFLKEDSPADRLFVIFEGELRGQRESDGLGNGRIFTARSGQVTGMLPYSRLTHFPNTVRAIIPSRVGMLPKDRFPEMLERIPVLGGRLVGLLSDRIREAAKIDQQREKLVALGKLSAGLAHELNNPAAAARRGADTLRNSVLSLRMANLALDKDGLPADARVFLARLECDWAQQAGPQEALDTLERSDLEEQFALWLQKRNIPEPWHLAAALVDAGCKQSTLEEVAARIPPELLSNVLIRLTASLTISRLVEEIESSTGKISELVRAVKEYTYMDQMPEQEVDVHAGIENTLIMLKHRLKNGVSVIREYDRTIPPICARGSELNQVWTNLIANAVDAMNGQGELRIRTSREPNCALVEIIDNGPGIPTEIQTRIFEPFFTTKGAGEGTGLGLDAVYRIVQNHRGQLDFESHPGETRFQVRLPFSNPKEETL